MPGLTSGKAAGAGRAYAVAVNLSSTRILCAALLAAAAWPAQARPVPAPTRGQLLYETHCIECHTTQMHWREGRKARSWTSLKAQVLRWQQAANLAWDDADVEEVTRHLNATVYHFVQPQRSARTRLAGASAD